jgi:hypothetical protein
LTPLQKAHAFFSNLNEMSLFLLMNEKSEEAPAMWQMFESKLSTYDKPLARNLSEIVKKRDVQLLRDVIKDALQKIENEQEQLAMATNEVYSLFIFMTY